MAALSLTLPLLLITFLDGPGDSTSGKSPIAASKARTPQPQSASREVAAATDPTQEQRSADEWKELNELLREVAERTKEIRRLNAEHLANPDRHDTGIAGGKNFTVLAPSGGFFARKVLDRAEALRKEIALAWLGREVPEGKEFTHINVILAEELDSGLTLLAGPGRGLPGNNQIQLETTRDRATGSTLAHEIVQVVLASRFPQGMPAFATEGIAGLYDDAERLAIRKQLVSDFARTNRWPSLEVLLQSKSIDPSNGTGYATAASLTEFLLAQGDRARFLSFVEDAGQGGWDRALAQHYRIASVRELQQRWQSWAGRNLNQSATKRQAAD
ncbi:MAG: hypothetical protein HY000_21185 [Planctomycetes bacterium]|nr:hypothetical protein [Planctomycetota bacterium]